MPERPTNPYQLGTTAFMACQRDPRFPYCLHVPKGFDWTGERPATLLVVVHGSRRMAQQGCAPFEAFAEAHNVLILAPLFPMWSATPTETEGYKLLRAYGVGYDEVVLAMIEEAAKRYPIVTDRFLMHGFSGGGQFAHRFFFHHPERLRAVSIGAPGSVTLLDGMRPWPVGTKGIGRDGAGPDIAAMRRVPVLLLVGNRDTDTHEVTISRSSEHWHEGINDCGANRVEKIQALAASLRKYGVDATLNIVDDVAHEGLRVAPIAVEFFARALEARGALEPGATQKARTL
ncbi:MAG TPA: alpha/beta hydrolase [Burkholderiales bacterium]|nr:alpha/beta hydrolase [Burkholderiales bacterium]